MKWRSNKGHGLKFSPRPPDPCNIAIRLQPTPPIYTPLPPCLGTTAVSPRHHPVLKLWTSKCKCVISLWFSPRPWDQITAHCREQAGSSLMSPCNDSVAWHECKERRPWTNILQCAGDWVMRVGDHMIAACCWPRTHVVDQHCSLQHHGSPSLSCRPSRAFDSPVPQDRS